jgi:hypothetical protein
MTTFDANKKSTSRKLSTLQIALPFAKLKLLIELANEVDKLLEKKLPEYNSGAEFVAETEGIKLIQQ